MIILASDLDGTLVFKNRKESISKEDIESIRLFQEKGNLFAVCTGRAVNRCNDVQSVIHSDFIIGTSGAHIIDKKGRTIYACTIPYEIVESIYNEFIDCSIFICLQANGNGHFSKNVFGFEKTLLDVTDFKESNIYGISITFESLEKAKEVNEYLCNRYSMIQGHQNGSSVDITNKECSKGKAVRYLKELYGLSLSCAIGDSYNDISMIQEADIGFTFHSSKEDIKRVSDFLVNHVYEAIDTLDGKS